MLTVRLKGTMEHIAALEKLLHCRPRTIICHREDNNGGHSGFYIISPLS